MHARPVPADPYNPLPSIASANGTEIIQHPSPFIPIRLPIFALVLWLNDCIIRVLNVGTHRRSPSANLLRGRHKSLSDTTEGAEEGRDAVQSPIRGSWSGSRLVEGHNARNERRRKID